LGFERAAAMRPIIEEIQTSLAPEGVAEIIGPRAGLVLLRSGYFQSQNQPHPARYSFVVARPFLIFQSSGSTSSVTTGGQTAESYGNPWHALDEIMARYELLDEVDYPFPLGGCFGFWGYDLKCFVEPKLGSRAVPDLEIPDSWVGFYSSVLVFDHQLGKCWIVATGLTENGSRSQSAAQEDLRWWQSILVQEPPQHSAVALNSPPAVTSSMTRADFLTRVRRAQEYIRHGHIYQVNLSHRLEADWPRSGWDLFQRLRAVSPAPHSAYLHCGGFELASSSPEMFLCMSGSHIETRPIKGTRPRSADPTRDAQLSYELQTSAKENSELVMITDLLRNDLGRVCEYGSVQVPELVQLERFPHVHHLISAIEGRLRPEVTHFGAFSSCFPGGSITGAPKIRAMEIIDELEPIARGPYTGSIGYLGFNRESQLSIAIRTALVKNGRAYFNVGAGIVADSSPEAEYDETIAKARGFLDALSAPSALTAPVPTPAETAS